MCSVQIKLAEQYETEALAYRSAVARMKESRGQEFERAWRRARLRH